MVIGHRNWNNHGKTLKVLFTIWYFSIKFEISTDFSLFVASKILQWTLIFWWNLFFGMFTFCWSDYFVSFISILNDWCFAEFWSTVPTHNKHIFVRPKKVCLFGEMCLFWENVIIVGSGGFCLLGIVYTV